MGGGEERVLVQGAQFERRMSFVGAERPGIGGQGGEVITRENWVFHGEPVVVAALWTSTNGNHIQVGSGIPNSGEEGLIG